MELSESEQGQRAEKRRKLADDHNSGEGAGEESNEASGEGPGEGPGEESRELLHLPYESDDELALVDRNDYEVANDIFGIAWERANNDHQIWDRAPDPRDFGEDRRLFRLEIPSIGRPIPESLLQLDALRELQILNSGIGGIPNFFPRWFGRMASLRVLRINIEDTSVIPEEISELHNLESLIVYADGGVIFPASFGNLAELKEIHIFLDDENEAGERLCISFPTSIGHCLTNLTEMSLSYIDKFPEEICSITSLEKLYVEGFRGTYPASIGRLKNLRSFENGILWIDSEDRTIESSITLPDEIGNLTSLETLILTDSCVAPLPRSICNLENLKHIDLSSSDITNLPDEIGNLTNLERIDLFSTKIPTLPSTMAKLKNLRELGLGLFESKSAQKISNLVESLPRLVLLSVNSSDRHIPLATLRAFDRIISRNRARERLGLLDSRGRGAPFPPSLWPLILKQAPLAFQQQDFSEEDTGYPNYYPNVVHLCMGPENRSQPDAIFHLLVNYGTTILQKK